MLTGLNGIIPGGISVEDFTAIAKTNTVDSQKILDGYIKTGIGTKQENKYYFEDGDKLKAAIELIKIGGPLDEISIMLSWKDFEGLVAEILYSKNFAIIKNLILTKPRMEIDVIGIRLGIAMLIDCKHWKRYSSSTLSSAVKKQIARTKHYILKTPSPVAFFLNFGDSCLNFELKFWLDDINKKKRVISDLNCSILTKFADNKIEIPYPQSDIHIKKN